MLLRINSNKNGQPHLGARTPAAILAFVVGVMALSTVTLAQNADRVKAGLNVWKNRGCADCHGSFADREKQNDGSPTGANLRTSRLDAAALKLAISCGRPLGPAPDNLYPAGRTPSSDKIDAVVAYLQARIIGRRRIANEECRLYYDDQPDQRHDIR